MTREDMEQFMRNAPQRQKAAMAKRLADPAVRSVVCEPDQSYWDACDAEFDDRWNARMEP